jgi:DNA uptake protein ComE-like DNA-binding protein
MMKQLQKQFRAFGLGVLLVTAVAACAAPASQAPTTGNTAAATATSADSGAAAQAPVTATVAAGAEQAPTSAKLNLNTVTEEELRATIPGFGNRMVREFMEYRPYISIQQFRREIGKYVDEAQVSDYEQYVYVPVNVNEADADTIMQIPGVDATAADALIAARPFASNAAFLDKLAEVAPDADRTAAESYLEAP